ncbi:MAG: alpha/beta hydrolase [Mailhella sp.]|nr:alpha/beta hydrolase [Mailhella sp.]
MVKTWNVSFPAAAKGERKRRAYVYLPAMYKDQPRRRFPVLYMFDGHNVFFDEDATFGKSWGLAEYLDFSETPLIVAAVECNGAPGNGRLSEYSPFDFYGPEVGSVEGRGEATMHWFIHEFKRVVDRRFRTIPWREQTFIGGSSMGGLMSLYAVARYNHIFSRAAALSPHIWAGKEQLIHLLRNAPMARDTVVYMDWGSAEVDRSMARDQREVADALFDRKISLTARVVPGGDHSEASWEKQAPFFIETLMYGVSI